MEINGGINSPYNIIFQKCVAGDIPVRIDNFCSDLFLKVSQHNLGQAALVNPFQSLLYTWDDPTKPRELKWNVYNNKKTGYDAKFEKVSVHIIRYLKSFKSIAIVLFLGWVWARSCTSYNC